MADGFGSSAMTRARPTPKPLPVHRRKPGAGATSPRHRARGPGADAADRLRSRHAFAWVNDKGYAPGAGGTRLRHPHAAWETACQPIGRRGGAARATAQAEQTRGRPD